MNQLLHYVAIDSEIVGRWGGGLLSPQNGIPLNDYYEGRGGETSRV